MNCAICGNEIKVKPRVVYTEEVGDGSLYSMSVCPGCHEDAEPGDLFMLAACICYLEGEQWKSTQSP